MAAILNSCLALTEKTVQDYDGDYDLSCMI